MSEILTKPRVVAAFLILGQLAAGCSSSENSSKPPAKISPVVQAVIKAANSQSLDVTLADGSPANLSNGTKVEAICVDSPPFSLRVKIESGPYEGDVGLYVPRTDLSNTNDPYHAQAEHQDPFGPLPTCNPY